LELLELGCQLPSQTMQSRQFHWNSVLLLHGKSWKSFLDEDVCSTTSNTQSEQNTQRLAVNSIIQFGVDTHITILHIFYTAHQLITCSIEFGAHDDI
jgi:hypothetical protein